MFVTLVADSEMTIGNEIFMYLEKPISKWVGPHIVRKADGKILT